MLGLEGETKDRVMAILAPRLCLNRYYLAEGVRIYSQVNRSGYYGTVSESLINLRT
jgi:hypothetical protein